MLSFACLVIEGPWRQRVAADGVRAVTGLIMKSLVSHEKDLDVILNEISSQGGL